MDGQLEGAEPQGDEVEAHLIKEAAVTAAAAGALFVGSAQARPVDPDPGSDVRVTQTQDVTAQPAQPTKKAKKTTTKKATAPHQRQKNRADTMDVG